MRSNSNFLLLIYLIIDLCVLNVVIILIAWISPTISLWNYPQMAIYLLHANLSWILTYFIYSKKNLYLRDGFLNRLKRITIRFFIFILIAVSIEFFIMPQGFSRLFFVEYTLLCYVLKILFYWALYNYLEQVRLRGQHNNRALIVGVNKTSLKLRDMIDENPILGYKFVGFVTDTNPINQAVVLGKPDDLSEILEKNQIEMVFITIPLFLNSKRSNNYLRICNNLGVKVRFIPDNQRWLRSHLNLESIGNLLLINPQEMPLDDLDARILKRTFDILFSGLFLVLIFSWLFPILAILIKLSSKGPVLFIQKRTGINNKTFNCYKFRSMQVNEDADSLQATTDDIRITKIGKFMRRTNLDEFPQFINTFLGQMSVVGPRPHMLKHTDQYSKLIDQYLVRHYVKPGVTGWAQVNSYRGETNELWKMEKRVEYDMEYIENWSLWLDVKIIFRTVFDKKTYFNAT